ncbi:MAG TPA: hypothetical protein VHJ78_11410 [Actinomycetota bacterium]|nr:hypothetical protein [Actinomycetota bacterium]
MLRVANMDRRKWLLTGGAVVVVLAGAVAAVVAMQQGETPEPEPSIATPVTPASTATTPPSGLPPAPAAAPPAPPPQGPRPTPPTAAIPDPPGYSPLIVTPVAGMENVHPISWRRVEVLDEHRVRVHFESGVAPCSVLDRVEVRYAPATITVTLYEGSDPAARDAVCILIAQFKAVDVQLEEPLAGRHLVDGAA